MPSDQEMYKEMLLQSVEDSAASVIHCLSSARYLECLNAGIDRLSAAVLAQTEADRRLAMLKDGDAVGAVLKQLKFVKNVDGDYLHLEFSRVSSLDFERLDTDF